MIARANEIFFHFLSRLFGRSSSFEIYTDGSSKNGVGSWSYIISRHGKVLVEKAGRVRRANSNTMEFQAAIEALNSVPEKTKATLFSDSRVLVDAMKLGKIPRAHQDQIDILNRLSQKHSILWTWVKAHNGHRLNERCDQLCRITRLN